VPVGHTEDLKNGACGLSSFVPDVNGWLQANGSRMVLPLTSISAAFAAKAAARPTLQAEVDAQQTACQSTLFNRKPLVAVSGVTRGTREDICPGRSVLGASN